MKKPELPTPIPQINVGSGQMILEPGKELGPVNQEDAKVLPAEVIDTALVKQPEPI